MSDGLLKFERLVRSVRNVGSARPEAKNVHPFDERNIHPEISRVALKLFNNGHYSQATFEAFKLIDLMVKKLSGISETGFKLMMAAFNESGPKIKLNDLQSASDIDEQLGYRHIFAGSMSAIRNPRGHEIKSDPIDLCLDHLSFASVLLRTIDGKR
ncbi:MAG: TIGR02391 family protein [Rhizobiales bacterium]|nr:TIGR02391 family protein [Hyphomicrobiales bacterium]MBN9547064.1 TIGR02391 family protein [Alphaproteobacteria bacterium]